MPMYARVHDFDMHGEWARLMVHGEFAAPRERKYAAGTAFLRGQGTGNVRAVRSYEKAGFVLEGRLREAVYKNGKYDDVLIMSVLRSEWMAKMKEK